MRAPELAALGGALGKLGGGYRKLASRQRPVPEHVRQAIAEFVPKVDDALMRGAAMRTGVAAIFDERDRSVGIAEDMVFLGIDRRIEPLS